MSDETRRTVRTFQATVRVYRRRWLLQKLDIYPFPTWSANATDGRKSGRLQEIIEEWLREMVGASFDETISTSTKQLDPE